MSRCLSFPCGQGASPRLWLVCAMLGAMAPLALHAVEPAGEESAVEEAPGAETEAVLAEVEVVALSVSRQRAVVRAPTRSAADGEARELVLLAVGDGLPGLEGARVAAILSDRLEIDLAADPGTASPQPPAEADLSLRYLHTAWLHLDGGVSVFSSRPPAEPPVYRPNPVTADPGQAEPPRTPRPVDRSAEPTPEAAAPDAAAPEAAAGEDAPS